MCYVFDLVGGFVFTLFVSIPSFLYHPGMSGHACGPKVESGLTVYPEG